MKDIVSSRSNGSTIEGTAPSAIRGGLLGINKTIEITTFSLASTNICGQVIENTAPSTVQGNFLDIKNDSCKDTTN